ncbi:MAG: family transposase [Propionibacteriaceae bacterium]|nr:family transposase [Propionibacteriaceae bacterium]
MIVDDVQLVVGVDTHVDTHTAALCDVRGRPLAERRVQTTPAGYAEMAAWAHAAAGDTPVVWAVEGTRHYGLGLSRFLASQGQRVVEIDRSRHVGKRRAGKSDPIDAVRAAKEFLAHPNPAEMRADGDREALRVLMVDRDHAVGCARSARAVLTSLIVTAPTELREQLRGLTRSRRPRACAQLHCPEDADRPTRVLHHSLARLGQRILDLTAEIDELEAEISAIVEELAPGMVADEPGLGALSLAQILLSWSHAGRINSEAAFGMLSGTAPVPVSSGRTDRYRLNRLGDRQLNRALHIVATNRMRHHPETVAYMERRRGAGKTDKEIRRCIKRYLARHLYRRLSRLDTTPTKALAGVDTT